MYYFFRNLVEIYIKLRYKVAVHGGENYSALPRNGGYIIACNHQTYADPPIIGGLIREKFSFMAKAELFKNPIFAWLIRRCGAFPVDRGAGDNFAIKYAVKAVRSGRVLVIFPEGTRSKDGKIGRARSGAAVIAGTANAPVIPVCIVYGQGGNKRRIDFALGRPIKMDYERFGNDELRKSEIKSFSERIINEIKNLQREILAGNKLADNK
ncbi:MAG: 1-acyl-sn-glycerol-3-phosphate acyltransferase [Eubacterium sp.]|nr:1-acyl-sn-glycerol-3-phosphate acyltransferase [Eubacterium sp.]